MQFFSGFFQPCTAKWPKKKNSVFKMWLKESLSIALGLKELDLLTWVLSTLLVNRLFVQLKAT